MSRTISAPEIYRANIVEKINDIISGKSDTKKCATNIEKSIYNYAIREATTKKTVKKWANPFFVQIYEDRLRSIYRNLQNTPSFVSRILDGDITADQLSKITHIEMAPDQWKELIDLKIKKDMNKFTSANMQASTDIFQCRKCKSRRCQYYELQTKSGDEPMTVFINCLDCGKRWRN